MKTKKVKEKLNYTGDTANELKYSDKSLTYHMEVSSFCHWNCCEENCLPYSAAF